MTEIQELRETMERVERTVLSLVPFRRLPRDLQKRAAELQGHMDARTRGNDDREDIALREFEKMAELSANKRCNAKWPKALIPAKVQQRPGLPGMWAGVLLPVVPLSGLVNRCAARNSFKIGPGEISSHDNAREAIRKVGLKITTLHKLGLGGDAPVVVQPDFKMPQDPWKRVDAGAPVEDDEEPIKSKVHKKPFVEEETFEVTPKSAPVVKLPVNAPSGITFDWNARAETFEESEAAQGVGQIPSGDEPDEEIEEEDVEEEDPEVLAERAAATRAKIEQELDEDEAEDLTTTEDDVEDDDLIDDDFEEELDDDLRVGDNRVRDVVKDALDRARAERQKIEDDTDWGPDEIDTHNPERERFEREAEEAAEREEALMASGDYYRKNGVVTRKAGR